MPAPAPARTARPAPPAPVRRPRAAGTALPHGAEALRSRPRSQPKPRLRVVDDARLQAAARRRRVRMAMVAVAVVAGASLFALAAFHALLVSGQVRLDELEARVAEAQARYSAQRLEVAELEAPEHVVRVAQERLGMVPPPDITYLTPSEAMAAEIGSGQVDQTPAPARDAATSWAAVKPYLGSRP